MHTFALSVAQSTEIGNKQAIIHPIILFIFALSSYLFHIYQPHSYSTTNIVQYFNDGSATFISFPS